jgi:hypothetical protein
VVVREDICHPTVPSCSCLLVGDPLAACTKGASDTRCKATSAAAGWSRPQRASMPGTAEAGGGACMQAAAEWAAGC